MKKMLSSLREAVRLSVRDGMTISVHHHLRNGDFVLNAVLEEAAALGIRDLTVNASSVFDVHEPIINHIHGGVVTGLECAYMSGGVGREISRGILKKPVIFRTHGGRAADILDDTSPVVVAFIAAPAADPMGNCTGRVGPCACGSLGYAFADAEKAKTVVIVTDNLEAYPLQSPSIDETHVDFVVVVDQIGNPAGIVSGTTRITRDPVGLLMADMATQVILHSGLYKEGMSFQTGAGGASLAVADLLKKRMLKDKVQGSFCLGGVTGYMVDMLEAGCFQSLLDVQCFDLKAVRSLAEDPRHQEISAARYASPKAKSSVVDSLDIVILGATQIDTQFNVNVHTDSRGYIMGGSGGHTDTAAGSKLCMVIAPLIRSRQSIVVDKVLCQSTPGRTVDILVTQRGIAVNPLRSDLIDKLKAAHLPLVNIEELHHIAQKMTGIPKVMTFGDQEVATVLGRDGTVCDRIYQIPL